MATPIGHALLSVSVGLALTRKKPLLSPKADLALFAAFGAAADLDFLPGIFWGNPSLFHHGASHSFGFALLAGLLMLGLGGFLRNQPLLRWFWLGFILYSTHLLLDSLTKDTLPPAGIPLFWPLSDAYVKGPDIFLDIRRSISLWGTWAHNLKALAWEALLLTPLLLIAGSLYAKPVSRKIKAWSKIFFKT